MCERERVVHGERHRKRDPIKEERKRKPTTELDFQGDKDSKYHDNVIYPLLIHFHCNNKLAPSQTGLALFLFWYAFDSAL